MAEQITWWVMAAAAVISAMMMLFSPNPVHKALWLVGTFISLGVIYLVLAAPLIFAVQLVVYAGAIMVLFLFVIMFFMNPEARRWLRPQLRGQLVIGGFVVIAFLVFLLMGIGGAGGFSDELGPTTTGDAMVRLGSPGVLGTWMFSNHLFAFELMGILLLVALIGATMVARDPKSEGRTAVPHFAQVATDMDNVPVESSEEVER